MKKTYGHTVTRNLIFHNLLHLQSPFFGQKTLTKQLKVKEVEKRGPLNKPPKAEINERSS